MDKRSLETGRKEPVTEVTSIVLEKNYQLLVKETNKLKRKIETLTEISHQLVGVIETINKLAPELSQSETVTVKKKLEYQLELGKMFGEILESGQSPNEWLGRYLVAAKEEAKEILRQAVTVSDIVSAPNLDGFLDKKFLIKPTDPLEKKAVLIKEPSTSYQSQLLAVTTNYESQCEELKQLVGDKATSLLTEETRR